MRIAIVGAGLAGATLAHQLAKSGRGDIISVFDHNDHVAGLAHTYIDPDTNIMVHAYGPHIFHTNDLDVWEWVHQFGNFDPYIQRTKAIVGHEVFSFPINLHTMNQVWGSRYSPEAARSEMERVTSAFDWEPKTFRDQVIKTVGPVFYQKFFAGYTEKQWGRDPFNLPASVAKRIPVRYNYDDNAYNHRHQGIPVLGYTRLVENMLDTPRISVHLGKSWDGDSVKKYFDFVFWTGKIDQFYSYRFGALPYRTLDFRVYKNLDLDDGQGCAVLNWCDKGVAWTRSTEHKHFTPERPGMRGTILSYEYPREAETIDRPFYPVRIADSRSEAQLKRYEELAAEEDKVAFVGRLGTYQYLDMDRVIKASLDRARTFLAKGC